MSIEVKMPALSPTMEKGTVAKWLVSEGDSVKSGDLLAEIETDKATMEFEAVDEGVIARILVPAGTDDVPVGTVLALIGDAAEGPSPEPEAISVAPAAASEASAATAEPSPDPVVEESPPHSGVEAPRARLASKVNISPLAARIAEAHGIDIAPIKGSGPWGRIVKADLGLSPARPTADVAPATAPLARTYAVPDIPHDLEKLSSMRRTIAQRLTEAKQQIPHIYLTVDIEMDALIRTRAELNEALAPRGIKISVNDLMIKALALALNEVPACNVQYTGESIARFRRADISVAVSVPKGLITPVVVDAGAKSLSAIAAEMTGLAARAREGRLQPHEYQGGTASLSNLGMFGTRQFAAVINPPQAMIMAVGTTVEQMVVRGGKPEVASVMQATGSFDHRAVDGADAAALMQAFKGLIEDPFRILA